MTSYGFDSRRLHFGVFLGRYQQRQSPFKDTVTTLALSPHGSSCRQVIATGCPAPEFRSGTHFSKVVCLLDFAEGKCAAYTQALRRELSAVFIDWQTLSSIGEVDHQSASFTIDESYFQGNSVDSRSTPSLLRRIMAIYTWYPADQPGKQVLTVEISTPIRRAPPIRLRPTRLDQVAVLSRTLTIKTQGIGDT